MIVSDIAGTTRDAIDTRFTSNGDEFVMVDTAGMRKKGKIYENTERYSVMRAMKAIDNSNVVLVVLNAEEGIREQDKRIAGYAHEAGQAIVIVVNKWDKLKRITIVYLTLNSQFAKSLLTSAMHQLSLFLPLQNNVYRNFPH